MAVNVHQHDVGRTWDVASGRSSNCCFDRIDHLVAIRRLNHLTAELLQHAPREAPVPGNVIHDRHLPPEQHVGNEPLGRESGGGGGVLAGSDCRDAR
jgi:hypothetical protein